MTHALLETVVCGFAAKVTVRIPEAKQEMLVEFEDLATVLLGVKEDRLVNEVDAHIYRVGVTNAADRGLDMWANFGPVVQVKHLTLGSSMANAVVDQIESDHIVVVCKFSEKDVVETITRQIGWGQRVRGIITEKDLLGWYEKCLRGKFFADLGENLIETLKSGFSAEFPHNSELAVFLEERGYLNQPSDDFWKP